MPIQFLDPTTQPTGAQARLAPRPTSLEGLTIGLLDNGKRNADQILEFVARQLGELYPGLQFERFRKPSAYKPAPEELLDQVAARCRLVITGVGD
mgnify:CR=1 FL=1